LTSPKQRHDPTLPSDSNSKKAGTPIPENDIWIAALAKQHQLPVLSNDKHFDLVKSIQRIGWD